VKSRNGQVGEMQVFDRVVARASFSAAAEELGLTPSAVSRVISRLEDWLGVRLLHRTTRRLSLTPEGEVYHLRTRDILAAIADVEDDLSAHARAPQGRLRVNCVVPFALHFLAGELPDFLARHPRIEVDLAVTDRIVDLLAENVDVAVRTGPITEPSLVVRRIGRVERGIFAAPAYLERRGVPLTPDDLDRHDCIRISSTPSGHRWPFRVGGAERTVEIASRISVDNADMALHLALSGAGLVRTSDLTVGAAVRDGRLVPLMADCHLAEPTPVSAVYPQGRHRMPKVRAFIDFLAERFARRGPQR
jgi:DNA-binding transcriptional LysR family regulator